MNMIGLDILGVLLVPTNTNVARLLAGNYDEVEWVKGAQELLDMLLLEGGYRFCFVSCSKGRYDYEVNIVQLFAALYGHQIASDDIHFVRTKGEKVAKCLHLGVNVMVDDDVDVLNTFVDSITVVHFGSPSCPDHASLKMLLQLLRQRTQTVAT